MAAFAFQGTHHDDAGVVQLAETVSAGADETWRVIGGFTAAGRFTGKPATMVSGNGGLGSIRAVGDAVTEKMVAQGERFYVYAQIHGPMAQFGYHGCLAVEGDADQSVIFYTLVFDAAAMEPNECAAERARLENRFRGAVVAMADAVSRARGGAGT